MLVLRDIVQEIEKEYPWCKRIGFYYHADIGEYRNEFVGVSCYHDGELDTSMDPDGWSLDDKVRKYEIFKDKDDPEAILVDIDLGEW